MITAKEVVHKDYLIWAITSLKPKNREILFRRLAREVLMEYGEKHGKKAVAALASEIEFEINHHIP